MFTRKCHHQDASGLKSFFFWIFCSADTAPERIVLELNVLLYSESPCVIITLLEKRTPALIPIVGSNLMDLLISLDKSKLLD
ncbi:hypothetical protein Tco_0401677 [Tanacetum coccineum]